MQKIVHFFTQVRRFFQKRWKLLTIIAIVLLAIGFWQYRRRAGQKVEMTFIAPERTKLTKTLDVSGIIDAKEKATLRFAAGGKVTYIGAKEGDTLKRGQVIARIDSRELQKRLQQDLNLYFNERMDFDEARDNRKDVAITNAMEYNAQREQKLLENSVLSVEIRDIAIKNNTLTTPIEGILVSEPTSVAGINLLATDAFEVINPKTLVLRATVDQTDISQVKKGQTAKITLDAYPDQEINTTVNYIAYKSAQSSTGTVFVVELPIPADYQYAELEHYRLGMNGDAKIVLAEKEGVLTIPLNTTKERDGKTYVSVKTGEKTTEEREIKKGLETDDRVEVVEGLKETDQVLVP